MKHNTDKLEIITYRRNKSLDTIADADKLIELNMLSVAMNRIYYAGFYIVNALMLIDKKKFTKHRQVIGWFNKEYLKTNVVDRKIGKILNDAYERRTALDYHDFTTVTKSEVKQYVKEMKRFMVEVNKVIDMKLIDLHSPTAS